MSTRVAATAGAAAPVGRRTLLDEVGDRLAEMLLAGDLEPGAPLRIDTLARQWGVSPTPVREALARAEASGLVVRLPLRGYQVAPELPAEDLAALMELRRLLEPHCAAVAARRADGDVVAYLEEVHEAMRRAPRGPTAHEYRTYLAADVAFHQALAAVAGNRYVAEALERCRPHVHRFRRFGQGAVDDADEAVAEHAAVLEAVRAADADRAAAAMHEHLVAVERRALATP